MVKSKSTQVGTVEIAVVKDGRKWFIQHNGVTVTEAFKSKAAAEAEAEAQRIDAEKPAPTDLAEHVGVPSRSKGRKVLADSTPAASDPNVAAFMGTIRDEDTPPEFAPDGTPQPDHTAALIAAMAPVERMQLARAERDRLAAWAATGKPEGDQPGTPILDWMTNPELATVKAARPAGAGRANPGSFVVGTDETHECSECHTVKPVRAFPTIHGREGVRAARCRGCRDAAAA